MDARRRALRKAITKMSRREATEFIKSFQLRENEGQALLLCDVDGKSVVAAALAMHCSCELVSKLKQSAYNRMNRDLKGEIPE